MKIYVDMCQECAKSLGGRDMHEKLKNKGDNKKCDMCKETKLVFDTKMFGIQHSGKLMDDISYRIINGLNEVKVEPTKKEIKPKLVFGQK